VSDYFPLDYRGGAEVSAKRLGDKLLQTDDWLWCVKLSIFISALCDLSLGIALMIARRRVSCQLL
jgi:hypothetical protein